MTDNNPTLKTTSTAFSSSEDECSDIAADLLRLSKILASELRELNDDQAGKRDQILADAEKYFAEKAEKIDDILNETASVLEAYIEEAGALCGDPDEERP